MSAYWLGVLTTPTIVAALWLLTDSWFRAVAALKHFGFTFEAKWTRDVEGISDYTLRHDIWWERSFGPFFAGGWYHERSRGPRFNRWIGVGRADGPCWMAFRKREFGGGS